MALPSRGPEDLPIEGLRAPRRAWLPSGPEVPTWAGRAPLEVGSERDQTDSTVQTTLISIAVDRIHLAGDLAVPSEASGVVVFAHGSGSSRRSPRNRLVAAQLQSAGLATLLMDLLTPAEELQDEESGGRLRFDIEFQARRLEAASTWLAGSPETDQLRLGYFGASTGAVRAPTLLIVGGGDAVVIPLNQRALNRLRCVKRLEIVPGATHLFEKSGALEWVAELAAAWFAPHPGPGDRKSGR